MADDFGSGAESAQTDFQRRYGYLFSSQADPLTGEMTYSGPDNQTLYDQYMRPEDKSIGGYLGAHTMDEGGMSIYGSGVVGQPGGIAAGTRAPGSGMAPAGVNDFGSFNGFSNMNAAGGPIIDPNKKFLDPNYGWITPNTNYAAPPRDWTSWGYPLMMAIASMGMGSAISAVGGASSGMFGASDMMKGVSKGGNLIDMFTSGGGQPRPGAGGTATPNSAGSNPLQLILQLLSRIGNKGP